MVWRHWKPDTQAVPGSSSSLSWPMNLDEEHLTRLHKVVKDYVEEASDFRGPLPEPSELDAIQQYGKSPELIGTILGVLKDRLGRGYPWNLKALHILLYLQTHTALSPVSTCPPLQELLPQVRELFYFPADKPKGSAVHIKSKAHDFLRSLGIELPARWDPIGGFSKDPETENPGEWSGWGWNQTGWIWSFGEMRNFEPPVPPKTVPWASLLRIPIEPKAPAWATLQRHPREENPFGDGYSISTTTITQGPLSSAHLKDHEPKHLKMLEEAQRRSSENRRWKF